MMGNQAASRFGQDGPSRITIAPSMFTEASEVMPYEPSYQQVIPFYPPSITNGNGTTTSASSLYASDEPQTWERSPSRLDISFRQGDDVLVPLYLQDPENPALDMSGWEWHSQIRTWPYYTHALVNEFTTDTDYFPVGAYHPTLGTTLVKLFLPRETNDHRGKYVWELYSIGPYDFSEFAQPADWPEDAEQTWPPQTALRTWLYGLCTIQGRTTDTDVLPDPPVVLPPPYPAVAPISSYGPNGRVP